MGALMIVKGCFIVFFCHRKEVAQQTGNEIKMCLSSADTRGSTVKSKGHLMTTGAPQKGGGVYSTVRDLKTTFYQLLDSTATEVKHVCLLPCTVCTLFCHVCNNTLVFCT